ncbi:cilia- and flagella-associated protein 418-like [Styela clava]
MDDIDDLLDEVEREFALNEKSERPRNVKKVNQREIPKRNAVQVGDDMDKQIDDILGQDEDIFSDSIMKQNNKKSMPELLNNASENKNTKCFPPCLGGTSMKKGISVTGHKRACNNLRCTSCDFKVLCFDNHQWNSSVDYLFFRNKMPDRVKLQLKLKKMPGCNAYCCQCSWKSIKEPTVISQCKDLKWVCGKH